MTKSIRWIGGLLAAIVILMVLAYVYSAFFKPTDYAGNSNLIGAILLGLLLGGVIAFLAFKLWAGKANGVTIKEQSHTVVESMRKVFKIVSAEGHFNELYEYEETKKLFGLIPSTKRALAIVHAKVLIGYDFEQLQWEANEETRRITLTSFPKPQILSMETDIKYHHFDEHLLNLLGKDDLAQIQTNAKKQVEQAVLKSGLMKVAAEQMQTLLTEVVQSKNWLLENTLAITQAAKEPPKIGGTEG